MNTKAKAIKSAARVLGPNSPSIVFGAFVRGYLAGHAAHTRWANKAIDEYRRARTSGEKHAVD